MRIHDKRMALVCFGLAAVIAVTGAASSCAKDVNPPAIQQSEISEWAVEGDNIDLTVRITDDIGVKEVFVQLDSGEKIPLTKLASKKDVQEISDWKASFKLPAKVYQYSVVARDSTNEVNKEGNITIYPLDADSDGIGYRDEIKYGLDPNKKNHVAKYLLDKNLDIYIPVFTYLDNDGVVDAQEKALIDLAIEYAPKITQTLPGLYGEIVKLPDLSKIEEKDVEAIQDILILAGDPKYKPTFESMLNEGIKDKRKYCSPLEALIWEAYDNKSLDDLLKQFSLEKLIKDAWANTSESVNYESERWKNFDEVVDRLNFPEGAYWFTENYFKYVLHDINIWFAAREFFDKKEGAGIDYATFITYCLLKNGYSNEVNTHETDAVCTVIVTSPLYTHAVNAVKNNGKISLFDASPFWKGKGAFQKNVKGPFDSIRDMVEGNVSDYWSPWVTCIITSDEPWEANEIILSKHFKEKLKTKSGRETVKAQLLASPWCAKGRNRWIIEELDNYKEGPISDEMFKPPLTPPP